MNYLLDITMKITKIIETRIDINDIGNMFCSDYDHNILQILKKLYVKKCFKSIFILDINRIVSRSSLHCKNKVLDGGTYIDISFEVSGIIYEKGEIIHNCKIIQINNNGTMHAKSEYASIHIKNVEGLVVAKENDEIPVIAHMVRCNIYEEEISISAILFMPIIQPSIIYKINNSNFANNEITDIFNIDSLTKLKKDINDIKKNNKNVYKFFTELLYPYKSIKNLNIWKTTEITLDNLLKLSQDNYVYNPEAYLDNSTYAILDVASKEKVISASTTTVLEIDKKDYILHLFNVYFSRLNTLLEFLQTYDTVEKIKTKNQIWSFYTLFKK
jgi:hypothetical protein